MNRSRAIIVSSSYFCPSPRLGVVLPARAPLHPTRSQSSRTFEFNYQVHFPATPGVRRTGPSLDSVSDDHRTSYQTPATAVSVTENVHHAMGHDPEYGDEFIVFTPTPGASRLGF